MIFCAYFVFNQFSVSGSHLFVFPDSYLLEWKFSESPVELSQGDKVTVDITQLPSGDASVYILGTNGPESRIGGGTYGNATFYYYVTKNDLYTFYIRQNPVWVPGNPTYIQNVTVMLNIAVIRSAPFST